MDPTPKDETHSILEGRDRQMPESQRTGECHCSRHQQGTDEEDANVNANRVFRDEYNAICKHRYLIGFFTKQAKQQSN
ncbi:hypothetical protein NDU88_004918 [Pleurodeles waltl]|uniref:Uncharacterized protein n=1 Tax=Pleurodeles waltl TaxID=8319 RepID=A0AAV7VIC9_PLEWA|nr:hypothetical protein NDU88_004918 [Pleurodeles waltl]